LIRLADIYILEPEVPGGIDEGTVVDRSTWPPKYKALRYELDTWQGDPLVAGFVCLLATVDLEAKFSEAGITGYVSRPVEVTLSLNYLALDRRPVPPFVWLDISGDLGVHDIAWTDESEVAVSARFVDVLRRAGAKHFTIRPF